MFYDVSESNLVFHKVYSWIPEYDDKLYFKNVLKGHIISNKVYPIFYEEADQNIPNIYYRSLEYLRHLTHGDSKVPKSDFPVFCIGLRDLFIASEMGLLDYETKNLLERVILITEPQFLTENKGLSISFYPNSSNFVMRLLHLDPCSMYAERADGLMYAFINKCELSYHNFENILSINSLPLNIDVPTNYQLMNIGHGIKKFNIGPVLLEEMLKLDDGGYYTNPHNILQRGGRRFIFTDKNLAKHLTNIIRTFDVFNNYRVNTVFRYNNFSPSDKKFSSHYDTPYQSKKELSTHTIILYLSSGCASPILKIKTNPEYTSLTQITAGDCIIFPQNYEHTGYPYSDSNKIFIRSELICSKDSLPYYVRSELETVKNEHLQRSELFNSACYLTLQSTMVSELNRITCQMFDLSARGLMEPVIYPNTPRLYKKFSNIFYITDGTYYTFKIDTPIKDAVITTVVDYFNGKIGHKSLWVKPELVRILNTGENNGDILGDSTSDSASCIKNFNNYRALYKNVYYYHDFDVIDYPAICTSLETGETVELPLNHNCEILTRNCCFNCDLSAVKNLINSYDLVTIVIMDEVVYLNEFDMVFTNNKIVFPKTGISRKYNFASCSTHDGCEDSNEILSLAVDFNNRIHLNIPDIEYVTKNDHLILRFVFFDNNFFN